MIAVARLVRLSDGTRSPFDGQYLVKYDPTRVGRSPDGWPMRCLLMTTRIRANARRFTDYGEVWDYIHRGGPLGAAYHIRFETLEGNPSR